MSERPEKYWFSLAFILPDVVTCFRSPSSMLAHYFMRCITALTRRRTFSCAFTGSGESCALINAMKQEPKAESSFHKKFFASVLASVAGQVFIPSGCGASATPPLLLPNLNCDWTKINDCKNAGPAGNVRLIKNPK